jgi:hypothetical protein
MWAHIVRPVLIVSLLAIAALGAGNWIPGRLSGAFSRFDKIVLGWLGGAGLLSLALFLVGQWRFSRVTAGFVLIAAFLLGLKPLLALTRGFAAAKRQRNVRTVPTLIALGALVLIGFGSLSEITGDWTIDAVVYHLLGPKVWIREGMIRPVPDNCHTAMPQTGETLFATAMMFGGNRAPGAWNFVVFCMLLLVSALLGRRAGLDSLETWWAVALLVTMPAVVTGSTHAFVDGMYAAFILAAARIGFDAESMGDFALLGLFGGFALGTKYTAILAVPAIMFCVLLKKALAGKLEWNPIQKLLVALAVAGLAAAPYYLRNWILLGAPIYPPPPLLWRISDVKYLPTEAVLKFHQYIRHRGQGFGRGAVAFLLLPFHLTYHTSNFYGAGGIGICPLGLSIFGFVAKWRDLFARTLAILGFLFLVLWFFTQQESRFLIHGYVMSAIFAVFGWRYVKSVLSPRARWLGGAVVLVSVAYGAFMIGRERIGDARTVVSTHAALKREQETIPFLESFQFINGNSSVRRVLILDPTVPPYYSDKPYVKPEGQWGERPLPGEPDSVEALKHVRELGVSHVMDVQSEISPFKVAPDTPGLYLVWESKGQRIYRID